MDENLQKEGIVPPGPLGTAEKKMPRQQDKSDQESYNIGGVCAEVSPNFGESTGQVWKTE